MPSEHDEKTDVDGCDEQGASYGVAIDAYKMQTERLSILLKAWTTSLEFTMRDEDEMVADELRQSLKMTMSDNMFLKCMRAISLSDMVTASGDKVEIIQD